MSPFCKFVFCPFDTLFTIIYCYPVVAPHCTLLSITLVKESHNLPTVHTTMSCISGSVWKHDPSPLRRAGDTRPYREQRQRMTPCQEAAYETCLGFINLYGTLMRLLCHLPLCTPLETSWFRLVAMLFDKGHVCFHVALIRPQNQS